jgi:hypothetical protein
MRFRVGDKVKVVATYDCFSGLVGTVFIADSDPEFPYRVFFEETRSGLHEGVYPEDELELVESAPVVEVIASGAITFSSQLEICAPVVVGGKRLDEVLAQYAKDGVDVEIVVRRKEAK